MELKQFDKRQTAVFVVIMWSVWQDKGHFCLLFDPFLTSSDYDLCCGVIFSFTFSFSFEGRGPCISQFPVFPVVGNRQFGVGAAWGKKCKHAVGDFWCIILLQILQQGQRTPPIEHSWSDKHVCTCMNYSKEVTVTKNWLWTPLHDLSLHFLHTFK